MNATQLVTAIKKNGNEALDAALKEAQIKLLQNARWRANKDMEFEVVSVITQKITALGGATVGKKALDQKDFPAQLRFELSTEAGNEMFNDLVIGHSNKIGCPISSKTEGKKLIVTYGFKKEDAKRFEEKLKGSSAVKVIVIGPSKS